MLQHESAEGPAVIGQPAHAWVSGQLARIWGNARFGEVAPGEEVCLAAEQHDVGWATWEAAPALNPQTGRPYRFTEMPVPAHLQIWGAAGPLVLPQSRYAALLVSLHGVGLYERRDLSRDTPDDARAIRRFLDEQRAFQETILAGLRADPRYTPYATPEQVARNRRLVAVWDSLSLALYSGRRRAQTMHGVPARDGETSLTLTPLDDDPPQVTVAPWPFRHDEVTLTCDGRRLPGTFADQESLRRALAGSRWVTLPVVLRPA